MPHCTNGNHIDEYPDEYRGAVKIGVNYRGWVEYYRDEAVLEIIYPVRETEFVTDLRKHTPLGQTPQQHIENSQKRFGHWVHVCEGFR